MSLINFPIIYIPDPDKGRPLFSGQIFVGKPDLDPEIPSNQKQLNVIEENGTVVAVPQPFILSAGGVPVYNGNPVRLDTVGNYSIKILSKLGAQIYFIENAISSDDVPGTISYVSEGADPTGVIPADDIIVATHEKANANQLKVVQNTGTFYWQNKTATILTDTDLKGMTVRMDELSGTPVQTYDQPVMYQIDRKSAVIELDTPTITALNTTYASYFNKYSLILPAAVFAQYAGQMIEIRTAEVDVNRGGVVANPLFKNEKVTLTREGGIEQPLTFTYSGLITGVKVYPREDFKLEFKLPKLLLEGVQSFGLLKSFRNNVDISGLIIEEIITPVEGIREVIHFIDCCDIYVHDFDAQAQPRLGTDGVYGITASGTVRRVYERIRGNGGYGFTGDNYVRQTVYRDCWINRVDCHWGAYDITIENCTLRSWGILACGGGTLKATNNTYYIKDISEPPGIGISNTFSFLTFRSDYGAEWDGDIYIDGLTYVVDVKTFVSFPTRRKFAVLTSNISDGSANYGRDMTHGRSITIQNVDFQLDGPVLNTYFVADDMQVIGVDFNDSDNNQNLQFYPHTINVSNVTFNENPELLAFTAVNPPRYMDPNSKGLTPAIANDLNNAYNMKINISNIHVGMGLYGNNAKSQKTGLVTFEHTWDDTRAGGLYPNYLTDDTLIRPWITVTNCKGARLAIATRGIVDIYDSTVLSLQTFSGTVTGDFGPDGTEIKINVYDSNMRFISSFAGSDSVNFPDETFCYNCRFDNQIQRDGAPRAIAGATQGNNGIGTKFKGTGNSIIATVTPWFVDSPFFFNGENFSQLNLNRLNNPMFSSLGRNLVQGVNIKLGTSLSWARAEARNYTNIYGNVVSGAIDEPRQTALGWLFESNDSADNADKVSFPSLGNIPDIVNSNFSMVFDVKSATIPAPADLAYIFSLDPGTGTFRMYYDENGDLIWNCNGRTVSMVNAPTDKQVCIKFDGTGIYLVVDGVIEGYEETGAMPLDIGTTIYLGGNVNGVAQLNGEMGECLFYNYDVSLDDLATLRGLNG